MRKPKFPRKMKKVFADRYNYGFVRRNIKYQNKMLNHDSVPYKIYIYWYESTTPGYSVSYPEIRKHRLFRIVGETIGDRFERILGL